MSPRLRAALALAGVFVLGAATGVGGARLLAGRHLAHLLDAPPAEARRRAILWALDKNLDLTKGQRDKIEAILAKHEPEVAEVTRSIEPKLAPIFTQVEGEIREVLTPEQQPKFEDLAKRFHARHHHGDAP